MALISGSITLSDSSRHTVDTGRTGFMFDIAPPDYVDATAITAAGSRFLQGDTTFLQGSIIGQDGLTLELKNWAYYGGYQQPDTTWVNGQWMFRWYSPVYLNYSIWFKPYNSPDATLIGCPFREPVMLDVGNYYASMVVPETPGHYEIRWLYMDDQSSFGSTIVEKFTSVSRGIDPMKDYPYAKGQLPYPTINPIVPPNPLVETIPDYNYKNLGDTGVFTLKINGPIPTPISYHWEMNGNYINDSTKFSGTLTDTLTIYDLSMVEAGSFDCVISNQITSSKAWMVLDPP